MGDVTFCPAEHHTICTLIVHLSFKVSQNNFVQSSHQGTSHQISLKHPRISRSNRPERRMSSSFSSVPKQNEGQPLSHSRHEPISGVSAPPPRGCSVWSHLLQLKKCNDCSGKRCKEWTSRSTEQWKGV